MKAIVQDDYGTADVLRFDEIDRPAPGADQVLIRVRAAGVDPGVWHLMMGLPYLVRAMGFGLRKPKNRVPGSDVAGVVEAVGEDVTRFRPGDEVYGVAQGSFAEYALAAEDKLAPKPANLSFEQAATVPISALAALHGLRDKGRVQPGQKVLIIGAAGGVGSFAVQLARAFGAHVTGVCSTSKVDLVRSLGADEVIDYTRGDIPDAAGPFDLILDTAGNRPLADLRRILARRGTLVIVGGEGGGRWFGGVGRLLGGALLSPFVGQRLLMMYSKERAEDLEYLRELIEAEKVTPVLDRTFPLADAAEAVRHIGQGHARGKVAIAV